MSHDIRPGTAPACGVSATRYSEAQYFRRRARWTLNDAIKRGRVIRPRFCEQGSRECNGPIEAHHDDYTKPLNVRWLCRKHHRKIPT